MTAPASPVSAGSSAAAQHDRWAWARIDLDAIRHNIVQLRAAVAPADVWAVVKADGYGHGAVAAARAAKAAGATGLCVALVHEGVELRAGGIDGPVLVLSEQPPAQLPAAFAADLMVTVASRAGVQAAAEAAAAASRNHAAGRGGAHRDIHGKAERHGVHLKVDTGMHRVGSAPGDAVELAGLVVSAGLRLDGVFTHLAVADDPDDPFTAVQLDRFDAVIADLAAAGIDPGLIHAANSAGGLAHPRARYSLVRAGIATYGISPGAGVDRFAQFLRPALSLFARVSAVRRVDAGERISYGLRHRFSVDTTVAVVPLGYADGVPRRSFECGVEVLVGGRRRLVVGTVTMDQMMIDCGHGGPGDDQVAVGDEVVLIGRQGDENISATEWADRLNTIGYEIVCGISPRVPRVVIDPGHGV